MTTMDWLSLMDQAGQGAAEPLPDGEYEVKVIDAQQKQTSTAKLMFAVKMQVLAGPHANRIVYNQFVLSPENPNALSFFFQHMGILGLDRSFFQQNPDPAYVAQMLVGRACKVKLSTRIWNAQRRNNVDAILPSAMGAIMQGPAPVPTPGMPFPQPQQPQPMQPAFQPQAPMQPQPQMPPAPMQPQFAPQQQQPQAAPQFAPPPQMPQAPAPTPAPQFQPQQFQEQPPQPPFPQAPQMAPQQPNGFPAQPQAFAPAQPPPGPDPAAQPQFQPQPFSAPAGAPPVPS
jgi:hypothetical protein